MRYNVVHITHIASLVRIRDITAGLITFFLVPVVRDVVVDVYRCHITVHGDIAIVG